MIHKKIEIKAHGMEDVGNLYTYFWTAPLRCVQMKNARLF